MSAAADRDPAQVRAMFARIARPYDLVNGLCSLGIDRYWRRRLVAGVSGRKVLDLATGSGKVALLLQRRGHAVTGMDFCAPMLELARKKGVRHLRQGDALAMPFADGEFDAVTIAFGFRNFADHERALREIRRVLKPGGALHILEFSNPAPWLAGFYYFYLSRVMPWLAGLISRNPQAYDYLANTVERFPAAADLAARLSAAGVREVTWRKYTFGIVAIHRGEF
ncbi:MAG: ubiquinone/menaquinone biosynthesis methyltransferase [Verrucomicrobiales bacterium]|jgi:demethylmenaquinone methyltransferase/2-methoxy-6-polyprenyl-1,4-benzoquinol methylase|nr:ubiquinone/menaquinone biosynthesis methyltransferase [Verrucomicrobiales bacterium]